MDETNSLLEFGADIGLMDGMGRSAMHELARHCKDDAPSLAEVCFKYLAQLEPSRRLEVLNRTAFDSINKYTPPLRTLGQMINAHGTWPLVPRMVELGLDVHGGLAPESASEVLIRAVRFVRSPAA